MKNPYIAQLEPNELVYGIFLVQHKDVRQKKSGEPYLSLVLSDRTGDLDARMFENAQEVLDTFERDSFVRVKGTLQVFQNRPQLAIHKIQPVPDSEVDIADFLPASKRDRNEMFAEVQQWISSMTNPCLKQMMEHIFADEALAMAYRTAPAAKSVHHAYIGGLIEHVLSMCHIAKFTAAHYPDIDFDLLLTGVLLHDIGKTTELFYERSFGYSNEGQLIGHIVKGIRIVEDAVRQVPGFSPELRDLVMHLVLSHHGTLEYGSPKVPVFLEAMLLHQIDTMDSKMECMRAAIEKDRSTNLWTGYIAPLERSVLKKRQFLEPESPTRSGSTGSSAAPTGSPQTGSQQPAAKPPAKLKFDSSSPFASKLQSALKNGD
jgi:3'-5' exoribonuclease